MTALDILILAVAGVAAVLGFRRGIVAQAGQIAAVIAGVALARMFGSRAAGWLGGADPSAINTVCAYIAVFVIVYGVVLIIFKMLRSTVHGLKLGIIDNLAGAAFKAAEWLLLLSIGLNIFFIISGGEGDVRHSDKPWRSATIDFAPAVIGYLAQFDNIDTDSDVKK